MCKTLLMNEKLVCVKTLLMNDKLLCVSITFNEYEFCVCENNVNE